MPPRAKSCPGCGACERTGWKEDGDADGLDAEDDFDYDKFVAEEFGGPAPKKSAKQWLWWVTAVILLIAFVLLFAGQF